MAQVEVPPARAEQRPNGRAERPRPVVQLAGDDAVPRGLAVASAVILRAAIVVGGIVLLALFAKRMMVVVIPVIIALLLATLIAPLSLWLRSRWLRPALASAASVALAVLVFLGLWAVVIPPFVSQVPDVVENVQQGAGKLADAVAPLGLTDREVQDAIQRARDQVKEAGTAGAVIDGAMLLVQWAAAIILI